MNTDWSERLILAGVIVLVWSMGYAILDTVTQPPPAAVLERVEDTFHRPTACRKLYDTGTDEWQHCMGVEEK